MPTTSPFNPASASNPGGWTSPDNILAVDAAVASKTLTFAAPSSGDLVANFAAIAEAAIPANSKIDGIRARVTHRANGPDANASLTIDIGAFTASKTAAPDLTLSEDAVGGPADRWTLALIDSDLRSPFTLALAYDFVGFSGSRIVEVDGVTLEFTHSPLEKHRPVSITVSADGNSAVAVYERGAYSAITTVSGTLAFASSRGAFTGSLASISGKQVTYTLSRTVYSDEELTASAATDHVDDRSGIGSESFSERLVSNGSEVDPPAPPALGSPEDLTLQVLIAQRNNIARIADGVTLPGTTGSGEDVELFGPPVDIVRLYDRPMRLIQEDLLTRLERVVTLYPRREASDARVTGRNDRALTYAVQFFVQLTEKEMVEDRESIVAGNNVTSNVLAQKVHRLKQDWHHVFHDNILLTTVDCPTGLVDDATYEVFWDDEVQYPMALFTVVVTCRISGW